MGAFEALIEELAERIAERVLVHVDEHLTSRPTVPDAYRFDQAAEALGLSPREVKRRVSAGELRSVHVGRAVLIPRTAVLKFLSERNGHPSDLADRTRTQAVPVGSRCLRSGSPRRSPESPGDPVAWQAERRSWMSGNDRPALRCASSSTARVSVWANQAPAACCSGRARTQPCVGSATTAPARRRARTGGQACCETPGVLPWQVPQSAHRPRHRLLPPSSRSLDERSRATHGSLRSILEPESPD
jgi:excisionase family DNA binding protein